MAHLEYDLCEELGPFLDCKWLVLEFFESLGPSEIEGDICFTGRLNGERLDDAFSWVIGVADGCTGIQAQRSLPSV